MSEERPPTWCSRWDTYKLEPVTHQRVLTSPLGKRVGYVMVKDMVSQAVQPITDAVQEFQAAGVTELVLDLRYNGGGLVSVGRDIASLIAGSRGAGRDYAALVYNDRKAAQYNSSYAFNTPPQALSLQRVMPVPNSKASCSNSFTLSTSFPQMPRLTLV